MTSINRHYILSTCLITFLSSTQFAHAEYFRMPLSMFTIVGDPGVNNPPSDPNSPTVEINNPGLDGEENQNSPNKDKESRFTVSPAAPFQLQQGTNASIDFSQYIINNGLGSNPRFRWQVTNGSLPHGMSLTGSVLSGAPTKSSDYSTELTAFYLGVGSDTGIQTYTFNVQKPSLNIKSMGSGAYNTCAITYEGGAWCWGYGSYIGASENKLSPWDTGRSNISHISTGFGINVCFLSGSTVSCLGNSVHGNKIIANVKKIVTGRLFACALTTAGAVKCWGNNNNGELGNGTTTANNTTPVNTIASDVIDISAGKYHACAILKNGEIKCWGKNNYYQTGSDNYGTKNLRPVLANTVSGAKSIVSGESHNCVLTEDSVVSCWGLHSRVGSSNAKTSSNLVNVSLGAVPPVQLSSSENSTCALLEDGTVKCWGSGSYGEVGSLFNSNSPVLRTNGVKSIVSGSNHHCVIGDTAMRCWGENSSGQLGNGSSYDFTGGITPVNIQF